MTSRFSADYRWASSVDADVVDPDDDIDHPSGQGGNNKYTNGWISETEPHEWENYVIKRREDYQEIKLERGLDWFDAGVAYRFGGIARYNGVPSMYISESGYSNKLLSEQLHDLYSEYSEYLVSEGLPRFADQDWTPLMSITKAEHDTLINNSKNLFTGHNVFSNVHNDNITAIGGYTTSQINSAIANVQVITDTHTARRDNPHVETAAGVGTIPSTGGNFIGRVNYSSGIKVGAESEVMFNSDKVVCARSNDGAIGLGNSDYRFGGVWQTLFAENTVGRFEELYNYTFSMPTPDVNHHLIFEADYLITFKRPSTLNYIDRGGVARVAAIDEPAFEKAGLKLTADTTLVIDGARNLLGATECTISYVLNNVLVIRDMHFLSDDLTYYFGKTGNVRSFKMWVNRLTPRQKKAITT